MSQSGTIGIVGGGQLGMMLTEAARKLGFHVIVVDPNENCPAAQAGAEQIVGDFYDAAAIRAVAEKADYLTVESEHVNTEVLAKLAAAGKPVNPAPHTIAMIQDKYAQKLFLRSVAPVADFKQLPDAASAHEALAGWGGAMIIKTRRGGFDGRGNVVVKSEADIDKALAGFDGHELYAEQLVDFQKELAVMVARDQRGKLAAYPVTETIHKRSICLETLTPAAVTAKVAEAAERVARQVVEQLEGAGVFGIEMFVTAQGDILVNEIAPRVHNSGHYTIEACRTSQFEQHIRAITGQPLGPATLTVAAAVMVNILGERNGPTDVKGLAEAEAVPDTFVHLYGKSPTKVDRKMGHITSTGATLDEARQRAEQARSHISL